MNLAALAESGDPEIGTLVSGSGLSQSSGPELIDFQRESKETLDMYWAEPNKATYANDCLWHDAFVERGAYRLCSFGKFTSGLRQSAIAAPAITCSNRTMDVSGVGAGPQAADLSAALRAVVHTATLRGTAQSDGDMFVSGLPALSQAEMTALLNMIARPESRQEAGRLDHLLDAAVAAAAAGDSNRAIGHLSEFAAISPRRTETLESLPSLSSIRGPVERLVTRLKITAKVEAEAQLAQAVKLMESVSAKELVVREIRAENLILIAGRFLDAGGYGNSVWSAQLSQLVINPRLWAPNAVPPPPQVEDAVNRGLTAGPGILAAIFADIGLVGDVLQLKSRARRMWFRAPLLVLLLAWFVVGLAGGLCSVLVRAYWPGVLSASLVESSFELWALGFLVLVAVGLYASVRNMRF